MAASIHGAFLATADRCNTSPQRLQWLLYRSVAATIAPCSHRVTERSVLGARTCWPAGRSICDRDLATWLPLRPVLALLCPALVNYVTEAHFCGFTINTAERQQNAQSSDDISDHQVMLSLHWMQLSIVLATVGLTYVIREFKFFLSKLKFNYFKNSPTLFEPPVHVYYGPLLHSWLHDSLISHTPFDIHINQQIIRSNKKQSSLRKLSYLPLSKNRFRLFVLVIFIIIFICSNSMTEQINSTIAQTQSKIYQAHKRTYLFSCT